jgi:outer membrane protein OmpA-like peptidoglycan-associated protein
MRRPAHKLYTNIGGRAGGDRELVLSAAIVVGLCACVSPQTHAPLAPPPAPVEAPVEPAPPPAQLPAKSTGTITSATAPRVALLDPRNEQQDENRIKLALAKNSRDSLESADVGYYMDVLQGRLKQIAGKDFGVDRQGDYLVLDMSFQSGFEKGSAQLDSSVRDVLIPLSKVLVEFRMTLVSVQVRAEDSGAQPIKTGLAERRAQALAHALVEAGIAGKRVVIAGLHSSGQAETDSQSEGHLRVEMRLEPIVRVSVSER